MAASIPSTPTGAFPTPESSFVCYRPSTCYAFTARTRLVRVVVNRDLFADALTQRRLEVCRAPVLLQQVTEGLVRKLLEVHHAVASLAAPVRYRSRHQTALFFRAWMAPS